MEMGRSGLYFQRYGLHVLLLAIIWLGLYMLLVEPTTTDVLNEKHVDLTGLLASLERDKHKIQVVEYQPINYEIMVKQQLFLTTTKVTFVDKQERERYYKDIWEKAKNSMTKNELFPESDLTDTVLSAMATARLTNISKIDLGYYESGTSVKWLVELEGGQRAVMKMMWEPKGVMKRAALCNFGYEMPWAEISAFRLHRVLGFRNTPYVAGREVDLAKEFVPVATKQVMREISMTYGGQVCVTSTCFHCKEAKTMCPHRNIVEVSLAYWIPRKLSTFTQPPKYMPFSTPNKDEFLPLGFNNRVYCDKIQKTHPYNVPTYFLDLFDFAVVDVLMYHYDSKHYIIDDKSVAQGLTVRLDHGRAFCASDRDNDEIFLVPLTQCCRMRRKTWQQLQRFKPTGSLTFAVRAQLNLDPISNLLHEDWFEAFERRLKKILHIMEKCAAENGGFDKILS